MRTPLSPRKANEPFLSTYLFDCLSHLTPMKTYPTKNWTMQECAFAVIELEKAIGRDACTKVATMAVHLMDHAKVMDMFPKEELTAEAETLFAKATEAYIRENRRRSHLN